MTEATGSQRISGRALSFPVAAFRVARIAPFHTLRGRRFLALNLLLGLPIVVSLILWGYGKTSALGVRGFVDFLVMFYFAVCTPVVMLFLGAGAIGDDLDDGTFLYLRLRPIPRGAIVVGRYLALWLSGMALLLPGVALLYVAQLGHRGVAAIAENAEVLWGALLVVAVTSAVYGALYLLLSLLMRYAVVAGLLLMVVSEFMARVPVPAARFAVPFHSVAILSHFTDEGTVLQKSLRGFAGTDLIPTARGSVLALLAASAILLAIAAMVFARREYLDKADS